MCRSIPTSPRRACKYMLADSGAAVLLRRARAAGTGGPAHPRCHRRCSRMRQARPTRKPPANRSRGEADLVYLLYVGLHGQSKGRLGCRRCAGSISDVPCGTGRGSVRPTCWPRSPPFPSTSPALELYLPLMVGARIELVSRKTPWTAGTGAASGNQRRHGVAGDSGDLAHAAGGGWRPGGFPRLCGGEAVSRTLADAVLEPSESCGTCMAPRRRRCGPPWTKVKR